MAARAKTVANANKLGEVSRRHANPVLGQCAQQLGHLMNIGGGSSAIAFQKKPQALSHSFGFYKIGNGPQGEGITPTQDERRDKPS
jgi:hypothetical protein